MKCEPHPSGYRCPICFPDDWFDAAPIGDTDRCLDCGEPLTADHRFACPVDRHVEEVIR
jgi:hypothetical protein